MRNFVIALVALAAVWLLFLRRKKTAATTMTTTSPTTTAPYQVPTAPNPTAAQAPPANTPPPFTVPVGYVEPPTTVASALANIDPGIAATYGADAKIVVPPTTPLPANAPQGAPPGASNQDRRAAGQAIDDYWAAQPMPNAAQAAELEAMGYNATAYNLATYLAPILARPNGPQARSLRCQIGGGGWMVSPLPDGTWDGSLGICVVGPSSTDPSVATPADQITPDGRYYSGPQ